MPQIDPAGPVTPQAVQGALGLSDAALARFSAWRDLLTAWNGRVNLVGPSTLTDFWRRHALDSAQLGLVLDPSQRSLCGLNHITDIGSGAGFPGLALAIVAADRGWDVAVTLIEPSAKRAAFLREAVRATGVTGVTVADVKAQDAPAHVADVITARAFAPLDRLLGEAHRFWGRDTRGVFLKGRTAAEEIVTAKDSWRFATESFPSQSDPEGVILVVRDLVPLQTRNEGVGE